MSIIRVLEPLDRCRRYSILFQITSKGLRDFIDPNYLLSQIDGQLDVAKLAAPLEQRYCPDFGRHWMAARGPASLLTPAPASLSSDLPGRRVHASCHRRAGLPAGERGEEVEKAGGIGKDGPNQSREADCTKLLTHT